MPRRRPARNEASKRPAPALPEGDEGKDMDHEKRREKVQTLIRDFKTEGLDKFLNHFCYIVKDQDLAFSFSLFIRGFYLITWLYNPAGVIRFG